MWTYQSAEGITEEKTRFMIRRGLSHLIVPDSAVSESAIISTGCPVELSIPPTPPPSLAVPCSVQWTSKEHKNKVKKFSGCFKISLKSWVGMRPARMWWCSRGVTPSVLHAAATKQQQQGSRSRHQSPPRHLVHGIYRLSFTLFSGEKPRDLSVDICYPGAIMCSLIGWGGRLWASLGQEEEVRYFTEVKTQSSSPACRGLIFVYFCEPPSWVKTNRTDWNFCSETETHKTKRAFELISVKWQWGWVIMMSLQAWRQYPYYIYIIS